ncbi:unnamed protein product [Rhizoctonia solani]|uniref:BTB domain-containing protein n=1 Tax=Rhizoctonia solani TaxID=456999 RepID=A0A8H3DZK3_9AGAM|nr:unnamed protein product [Rhizoctonia solani]
MDLNNPKNVTPAVKEEKPTTAISNSINHQNSSKAATQPKTQPLKTKPSLFALHESFDIVDFTGANIRLQIGSKVIKTYERRLEKFAGLRELIQEARQKSEDAQSEALTIIIDGDKHLFDDFRNMFELLNVSSIDQPSYGINTRDLVSAARIAAPGAYNYKPLYRWCITNLEGMPLSSMERIHVARALAIKSWEKDACEELSRRKEMITRVEAAILGMDAYWQIASDREKRRGANFEHVFEGIQRITRGVFTAKQRYMPILGQLLVCVSLIFWLLYFLLWFGSETKPVRFMILFKASKVVMT